MRADAKAVALIGIFLVLALVAGLLERMVPLDFAVPGVRLGLSNVVVLLAIYVFRFRPALCLVALKCLLLAALTGNVSGLAYSLSGSLLALLAMYPLAKLTRNHAAPPISPIGVSDWSAVHAETSRRPANGSPISPIGVSVCGAVCHIVGQLFAAAAILETMGVFAMLPLLAILGGATGILVGVIVKLSLPTALRLSRRP